MAPPLNDADVLRRLGFALAGQFLGTSSWDGMLLNVRSSQVNLNSTLTIPGRVLNETLTAWPNGVVAALAPHVLWMLPEGDEHIPWVLDELSIRVSDRGELMIAPASAPTPPPRAAPGASVARPPAATTPRPPAASSPQPRPASPSAQPQPRASAPAPPAPAAEEKSDTFFVLQEFTTTQGPPTMPTTAYRKTPTPGRAEVSTEYTLPRGAESVEKGPRSTDWTEKAAEAASRPPPAPPPSTARAPEKHHRFGDLLSDIRHGAPREEEELPAAEPEPEATPEAPKPRFIPDMRMKKEIGPGFLSQMGILPAPDDLEGGETP